MLTWLRKKFTASAATPLTASWLAAAGRDVFGASQKNPVTLTSVHAAVRLLSAGLLGGDLHVAQRLAGGGSRRLQDGPAASSLARTSLAVLQPLINDWLIHGNAYAEVQNGRLVRIPPARAMLVRKDGTTEHHLRVTPLYSDVEEVRHLAPGQFLHLKMLPSESELMGQSPLARVSPALAMAVQVIDSAGQMITNAASPGSILVVPGGMKSETRSRLREDFRQAFSSGSGKAGATAVLDMDARLERIPTPESMLAEAHVALAKFGVAEVARAYGVPLSLLAETSDTNRSTAAEEARQFSIFGVQPLARQLADALSQFLLSEDEILAGQAVVIDLRDALLGHGQERAAYASTLVNAGLATRNELRDLLGLADTEGGDMLAVPANTTPIATWLEGPQKPPESVPAPEPVRTYSAPPQPPQPAPDAPEEAEVIDMRVAIAEARLRAYAPPQTPDKGFYQ